MHFCVPRRAAPRLFEYNTMLKALQCGPGRIFCGAEPRRDGMRNTGYACFPFDRGDHAAAFPAFPGSANLLIGLPLDVHQRLAFPGKAAAWSPQSKKDVTPRCGVVSRPRHSSDRRSPFVCPLPAFQVSGSEDDTGECFRFKSIRGLTETKQSDKNRIWKIGPIPESVAQASQGEGNDIVLWGKSTV